MNIRRAQQKDLATLLSLYTQLHDNPMPTLDASLHALWDAILTDPNHHILLGFKDGQLVSSCVLILVPNLTRSLRPYALIENVITDQAFRRRGFASKILAHAKEIAQNAHCYKIMLMTGSKDPATLQFYRNAGYNDQDKTAFIQWI